jgi:hypothetical protein
MALAVRRFNHSAISHSRRLHIVTVLQVLKELDSLCKDSSLTPEALKAVATRLFRHSQHLLDEFLMLGKAGEENLWDSVTR